MHFSIKPYQFLYLGVSLLGSFIHAKDDLQSHPIEFVILIASYNNENYAVENLQSACFQKSSNPYQVIYINDVSTDRTREVVESYIKEHRLESLVTLINNEKNVGQVGNYYNTIHSMVPDHKIIVLLDGDDKLAHDQVLTTLEKYYSNNPDIWMTYGSNISFPHEGLIPHYQVPDHIIRENTFRKNEFITTHLISFRARLYKKIKKEDFMFQGNFIKAAGDLAFMFPMLEMCSPYKGTGPNHSYFIPEILYHYRANNPLSEFRDKSELQESMDVFIRSKKPYEGLESLESCDTFLCRLTGFFTGILDFFF
jgi:glycosyltransferase involved in cell wall biosynthesis